MDNKIPYYRIYLNEPIRKALGINLKNKKIYAFKINELVYLSTTAIANTAKSKTLKARLGWSEWIVDIPTTLLDYTPTNYTILNTNAAIIRIEKRK